MNKATRAIFIDSTIKHSELLEYTKEEDLLCPGIQRGDLVRTLNTIPNIKSIVIIDGVFEQQASITHKEILWALDRGVEVIGISSIGALRAAELKSYGMKGYGTVFRQYIDGEIDGDDEVAISHFPGIQNQKKTIAMVNIRATLSRLKINDDEMTSVIRNIHYKERTWSEIRTKVSEKIYDILTKNYIDQKREDVISYFELNQYDYQTTRFIEIGQNIYFLKDLVTQRHARVADFLEYCLNLMPKCTLDNSKFHSERIAEYIISYLELPNRQLHGVAYILNELKGFRYTQFRIKKISDKIRREQRLLLSSDFINFIENKKIPMNNLQEVFDGILKLEAFFLTRGYVLNTL